MNLQVLGIDLGKTVFHLVGLDSTGRVVIRKRCLFDVSGNGSELILPVMRSLSGRNFAADLVEEIEDETDLAHRSSLS